MTFSESDVEQALAQEEAAYWCLKRKSELLTDWVGSPLPPVRDRPVQIRMVHAADLHALAGQVVNGVATRVGEQYTIFVCDKPTQPPSHLAGIKGDFLKRYIILHEFGHVLNGDVLADDPQRTLTLRQCPSLHQQEQEKPAEACANVLLRRELQQLGDETGVSYRCETEALADDAKQRQLPTAIFKLLLDRLNL